jgi:hypothetical protein
MASAKQPDAPSSNVDMLRLEYPRTAMEVYNDQESDQTTIDMPNPSAWLRLLIQQQQQAQWDLEQLFNICGDAYDRADRGVVAIERTYGQLVAGMEYIYAQYQTNAEASQA